MIRYAISAAQLRSRITAESPNWFSNTTAFLAGLPAQPASSDFSPFWSEIKQAYIKLQCSKCCFCEKPLEGKIEQDVEHFRPKAEVKSWKIPAKLAVAGVTTQQPANGAPEPGYRNLAYAPFNYAMACKTCNSTLKKNFFPIEGSRDSAGTDPTQMPAENALLMYPIGSHDTDPEQLIEFIGLSPIPKLKSGFGRRRAMVTIEIFRLDDSKLRSLFKYRAYLLRLLYLELEGHANAATAAKRQEHGIAIDTLTSDETPFASCMRSYRRLYAADPAQASQFASECLKYMNSKSMPV